MRADGKLPCPSCNADGAFVTCGDACCLTCERSECDRCSGLGWIDPEDDGPPTLRDPTDGYGAAKREARHATDDLRCECGGEVHLTGTFYTCARCFRAYESPAELPGGSKL